jgi:hypothetical protein
MMIAEHLLEAKKLTMAELEAAWDSLLTSPQDLGAVEMIVRRPAIEEREILSEGELDLVEGLVGDNWRTRGSSRTTNGLGHPEMQLNIMNAQVLDLVAQGKERWHLAGDQLIVDLDLSQDNLPPGTRLALGTAVIEVTPIPHTGCQKFVARFGADAMKFVNSPQGKIHRLRGLNAKVVVPGVVRVGDVIRKIGRLGD